MSDLLRSEDHTESINHAIAWLAPRWTTWTLQTIQQRGPMRRTFSRGSEFSPTPSTVEHSPTAQQADTARATAAVQRSPSAFPGLFSHAPDPQPPVPLHVTALSRPSRTR
ncbi:hypothetical protein [Streptomyces sp. Tue6028]|uniref:hypothetical protein n=1 Tax=Streptomyces sp. Tue6028 TaxID=2036037 RepID=UPI003EC02400